MTPSPPGPNHRLAALRRFAVAITILTVLGHTVLGFETSWAVIFIALAVAYGSELLLEALAAHAAQRRPQFAGGPRALVDFLLPGHITALAIAMLLYSGDLLAPIAFAVALGLCTKAILRVWVGAAGARSRRHFLNPSNTGIAVTLMLFPHVSIAPPYQFTETLAGAGDWGIPALIVLSGSFLNWRYTRRLPLIVAWMLGFAAQAVLRCALLGVALPAALAPMTGMAFVLFSFYMVSDPATTPERPRDQVLFGAAVAACYGCLQPLHVTFGFFFALAVVCALRGCLLGLRGPIHQARA